MKFKPYLYRFTMPFLRLYWRIFKPVTFGVRILITHPRNPDLILLIRHTYGNQNNWNIPGGGYNPNKETPKEAAVRETREEVGITLTNINKLGIYKPGSEIKKDTVTMFSATTNNLADLKLGPEIAESDWKEYSTVQNLLNVSAVAKKSIEHAHHNT